MSAGPVGFGEDGAPPGTRLAAMRRARAERAGRPGRRSGGAEGEAEDPAALAAFLRALRAAIAEAPAPGATREAPRAPAAVLPFRRRVPRPAAEATPGTPSP